MNNMKYPIGIQSFEKIITEGYLYIDKTALVCRLVKTGSYYFLSRPRRFGKSIFLSMLHSYYDCNQSAKFQSLFGNLWIGQHPTELQGKYQVLFLDFSQVSGNIDSLERNFDFYCSVKLDGFMRRYGESYSEETREKVRKAEFAAFDIHDRVNFAVREASTTIDDAHENVTLTMTIDTQYCSVMDYFEIFLERMVLCRTAAQYLELSFELVINGVRLL